MYRRNFLLSKMVTALTKNVHINILVIVETLGADLQISAEPQNKVQIENQ